MNGVLYISHITINGENTLILHPHCTHSYLQNLLTKKDEKLLTFEKVCEPGHFEIEGSSERTNCLRECVSRSSPHYNVYACMALETLFNLIQLEAVLTCLSS